jgi:5-methylcytosine-specific restriction endonuclease McrA
MGPLCTFPSCFCKGRCHWVGQNSWRAFDGKPCPYCDKAMHTEHGNRRRRPTVDHVIPLSKGGRKIKDNCAFVCAGCNQDKADTLIEAFAEALIWAGDPRAKFVAAFIKKRKPQRTEEAA